MSNLVCCCCTSFWKKGLFCLKLFILGLGLVAGIAHGQEDRKVPISFVPPPLENATYSLGIYEAKSGKLVRRLQEIAPESAFTVGLNGLITNWDGKDDGGKAVAPGRYAARGYAVGTMKVEGVAILGNDWAKDDEALRMDRIEAIALVPADNGLAIVGTTPLLRQEIARYGGEKDEILWSKADKEPLAKVGSSRQEFAISAQTDTLVVAAGPLRRLYLLSDGIQILPAPRLDAVMDAAAICFGKDGTTWKIEAGILSQYSSQGERLRKLTTKEGEPQPVAVSASQNEERLYLLEETKNWQRVRGLSWAETKEEDGKQVSAWQTFFERSIRQSDSVTEQATTVSFTEITLMENPLLPGKTRKLKLIGSFDSKGSYLSAADGLRLRQISQRPYLRSVKLAKNKTMNDFAFLQGDGAAWDEFSIEGAKNMMEFDAGEIEMTADGEKAHTGQTAEPPDL